MSISVISIGILFNALACTIVSGVALALVLFLHQRWHRLSPELQAYTWFWWFTVLVWLVSSIHYLLAGFGYVGHWLHQTDIIVQAAVFFTGPPLTAYVTLRIWNRPRVTMFCSLLSVVFGIAALGLVLQPGGLPLRDVTYFSADAAVNTTSFIIFSIEAGTLLALVLYDIVATLYRWQQTRNKATLYEVLFSVAIVIYLVLGSIDESKIIVDWPSVVFRLLYAGAFLMAYLTIIQQEATSQSFLESDDQSRTTTYA